VGVVIIIILAIAVPMGLKAKHRRDALRATIQAQQGSPRGDVPTPSYAASSPLESNTAYAPDARSSIFPAPTTL
jgi:hypothetical protein